MSLGALDFGLIVDGSIVVVENSAATARRKRRETDGEVDAEDKRGNDRALRAKWRAPVLFGMAIIALVYVPVLSLSGVEGKLFQPMAEAVMLAIASGLACDLHDRASDRGLAAARAREQGKAVEQRRDCLGRAALRPAARARAGASVRAGDRSRGAARRDIAMFLSLGSQFTPQLDEGSITAMVYKPVGMSLDASLAIEQATERDIRQQFPMITHTFSRIGTSEVATDPMPPNENDLYIFYEPEKDWPKGKGKPKTKDELNARHPEGRTRHRGGQSFEFAQPIQMRFNEMLEGTSAPTWRSRSSATITTSSKSSQAQAKQALQSMPGTAERRVRNRRAHADRDAVAQPRCNDPAQSRYGPGQQGDLDRDRRAEVGSSRKAKQRHTIVMRMPEALRADPARSLTLPIRVGEQGLVPLSRVAGMPEATRWSSRSSTTRASVARR